MLTNWSLPSWLRGNFFKVEHGSSNRQHLTYILAWILLLCPAVWAVPTDTCSHRPLASVVVSLLFESARHMATHNCITTFAVMSCRIITCESILSSPLPFLFFVGAKREPRNKALLLLYFYIIPTLLACFLAFHSYIFLRFRWCVFGYSPKKNKCNHNPRTWNNIESLVQ